MGQLPIVYSIGEAMLELTEHHSDDAKEAFAGDTYNTSVYLSRLGVPTQFVSAIGKDPFSGLFLDAMSSEGVGAKYVLRHPSRLLGMYVIETDQSGERSFHYCRAKSAARKLFEIDGVEGVIRAASHAKWLYLTGITLSIFNDAERQRLAAIAGSVRANGGQVVFDPNFRAKGWENREHAKRSISAFARCATIVLPTLEDENALWGTPSAGAGNSQARAHAARWFSFGVKLVVMKCGEQGAELHEPDAPVRRIPVPYAVSPIDTTGAGDSFNAGLMAGLIHGRTLDFSSRLANRLAGIVIRHPGAIAPRHKTPKTLLSRT